MSGAKLLLDRGDGSRLKVGGEDAGAVKRA